MSAVDYTIVIASCISALGAITSAAVGAWIARQVRTPSGDTLGAVAERTHDMASVTTLALADMNGKSGVEKGDTSEAGA